VENGVAVRMALLYLYLTRKSPDAAQPGIPA
jgi:aspartate carbamoyltransferase catalytic subunit